MLLKIVLIVIILSEITGMATRSFGRLIKTFRFYTQLSNLTALISAALLLMFGSSPLIAGLRFMAVCLLIMTMLVTIFVLVPTIKNTQLLLWSRVGFLLHLFCPVLNLISYLFLENHADARMIALPVAFTLVYGDIMLYLNYLRKIDGPYPFLRYHNQSRTATFLWFCALCVLLLSIAYGVYFAAQCF